MGFINRLQHGWNAFRNRDPTEVYRYVQEGYSYRPDRMRFTRGNERSIVNALYTRIAIDCSSIQINHCDLDKDGRFKNIRSSGLNNCLSFEANLDQTGRALIQDIVASMLDEGCIAVVPVDTTFDPRKTDSYDIQSMRVGKITQWYPDRIKVELYNEKKKKKESVIVPKRSTAIIENPLYSIINEPNSTMQRLIRKLNLLDVTDEHTASGKLDLIIGLPYQIRTEGRRKQANERMKDIEMQLSGSKYGIAYTDGTEHITQLNRPVENNLMKQVEYLTSMLYSQLGITASILDGTAEEQTMLNYYSRTIEPIISAIVCEMERKFLTKTARTKGQAILFFRDVFKLVPVNSIADIADKFTRNEILSSNEIRQIIGRKPSSDPKADQLINSNLNQPEEKIYNNNTPTQNLEEEDENQNG